MRKTSLVFALFLLVTTSVFAHGPTRQTVAQTVTVNAPADKVWALVGDFSQLHEWHPAVKSTEMKDDETRLLTLQDGNTITEKMKRKNDETMTLSYKIIDMSVLETIEFNGKTVERKTLPVDTYTGILKVAGNGDKADVSWTGKFYPAWLFPPPFPEGMSDKDGVAAIEGVYKAGLENLKASMEELSGSTTAAASGEKKEDAAAQTDAPTASYASHLKCDADGKNCMIDKFLTKGFRAFAQCQVCHGIDGNGSTIGPSLMVKLKELDKTVFYDRIENGFQGQIGVMPPWKANPNVMKNIDNLYEYLSARADGVIPAGKIKRFKP